VACSYARASARTFSFGETRAGDHQADRQAALAESAGSESAGNPNTSNGAVFEVTEGSVGFVLCAALIQIIE